MKTFILFVGALLFAVGVYSATIGKRTWEYKFIEIGTPTIEATTKQLHILDSDGWETVGLNNYHVLLRRRFKE